MSTFRCSSPCYHHKRRNLFIFHPMTNVTIIPSFIQKSFLSVIYSPRLTNFSHFSSPCYRIETNILRYIPREDSQSTVIVNWRCRIPSLRLLVTHHSWTRTNKSSSRPLAFSRSLPCQPEASSFQSWKDDNNVKSPTGTLNPEATNENWPNERLPDAKSMQPQAISCNCLPRNECEGSRPNFIFCWTPQKNNDLCLWPISKVQFLRCSVPMQLPYQKKPIIFILIHLGFESSITKQRKCISAI